MNRTSAAGSSSGAFVDKNVGGGIAGTKITATDMNAHQEEIIHLIEAAGITPSGADLYQAHKAVRYFQQVYKKEVGELFFLADYRASSAWNPASPDSFFGGVCLSCGDKTVTAAQYPDLVTYLRARKAVYLAGQAGAVGDYTLSNWAVSSNVGTLTFANNAANNALLAAMKEDQTVHGSFTNWRSVTIASLLGNIPAGDYALTAIDTSARTVSFAVTAANGSGATSVTVAFYPFRIVGSATSARLFDGSGRALVSAGDADGDGIAGLRRRDRYQGHSHASYPMQARQDYYNGAALTGGYQDGRLHGNAIAKTTMVTDDTNGTPRVGKTTDPRSVQGHLYIWAGRVLS